MLIRIVAAGLFCATSPQGSAQSPVPSAPCVPLAPLTWPELESSVTALSDRLCGDSETVAAASASTREFDLELAWGSLIHGSARSFDSTGMCGYSQGARRDPTPSRQSYSAQLGDALDATSCFGLLRSTGGTDVREPLFAALIVDRLADPSTDRAFLASRLAHVDATERHFVLMDHVRCAAQRRRDAESERKGEVDERGVVAFERRALAAIESCLQFVDPEVSALIERVPCADGDPELLRRQLDGEVALPELLGRPAGDVLPDRVLLALRLHNEPSRAGLDAAQRRRVLQSAAYAVGRWLDSVDEAGLRYPIAVTRAPVVRIIAGLMWPSLVAGNAPRALSTPISGCWREALLSHAGERALGIYVRQLNAADVSDRGRAVRGIARILERHPEHWDAVWPVLLADWLTTAPAELYACDGYEPVHWSTARREAHQEPPSCQAEYGSGRCWEDQLSRGDVEHLYRAAEYLGVERLLEASRSERVTTRLYALRCLSRVPEWSPALRERFETAEDEDACVAAEARRALATRSR
jgi:hypothetical protein